MIKLDVAVGIILAYMMCDFRFVDWDKYQYFQP